MIGVERREAEHRFGDHVSRGRPGFGLEVLQHLGRVDRMPHRPADPRVVERLSCRAEPGVAVGRARHDIDLDRIVAAQFGEFVVGEGPGDVDFAIQDGGNASGLVPGC